MRRLGLLPQLLQVAFAGVRVQPVEVDLDEADERELARAKGLQVKAAYVSPRGYRHAPPPFGPRRTRPREDC